MQAFKSFSRTLLQRSAYTERRCLTTASIHPAAVPIPWFIDPSESASAQRSTAPLRSTNDEPLPPLPESILPDSPIGCLHAQLASSPHLEPGCLYIREPIPTAVGPPLPLTMPKGRRKRGRTYSGEGVLDNGGGIWNWVVIAQVKEGTEKRGTIESIVRIVRKSLLTAKPPLPLPPNSKRRIEDGWAMIDAGDFAVHVVSKSAREKFFPDRREW